MFVLLIINDSLRVHKLRDLYIYIHIKICIFQSVYFRAQCCAVTAAGIWPGPDQVPSATEKNFFYTLFAGVHFCRGERGEINKSLES